jgi:hypothetical protein
MNTAENYSRSVTIPEAITRKNNPNIQRSIPLNVIFSGFFDPFLYPNSNFSIELMMKRRKYIFLIF